MLGRPPLGADAGAFWVANFVSSLLDPFQERGWRRIWMVNRIDVRLEEGLY